MATFTFTPDYNPNKTIKPNVTTVQFGDGYEQRFAKGLNSQTQAWSLQFKQREEDEANNIEAFLIARGGIEAFDWTPPDSEDSIRVKCTDWQKSVEVGNRWTITTTFTQVYEP
jgi:phage-related protein